MKRRNFLGLIGLAPVVATVPAVAESKPTLEDARKVVLENIDWEKLERAAIRELAIVQANIGAHTHVPLYDPRSDSNDVIFDSISSYDAKFRMTSADQFTVHAD